MLQVTAFQGALPAGNINGNTPPMFASVVESKMRDLNMKGPLGLVQDSPQDSPRTPIGNQADAVLSRPKVAPRYPTLRPQLPAATNTFVYRGPPQQVLVVAP